MKRREQAVTSVCLFRQKPEDYMGDFFISVEYKSKGIKRTVEKT